MIEKPNCLVKYWPENVAKNVIFVQNDVKVDIATCVLWQNTKDWVLLPKNRTVRTYFILMPIKGRVLVKTEKNDDYIERGRLLFLQPNTVHTLAAAPNFGDLHSIELK